MLDTNILSDMLRFPHNPAALRARHHQSELCTCIVVASELRYGCAKKGSLELLRRAEDLLAQIPVLALDLPTDSDYGRIRAGLEADGNEIGGNDLFIAAHASSLAVTLFTGNVREFSRVSGLKVENRIA